jgi:hypothetical protein
VRDAGDECVHLRALREEETGGGRALAPRGGGEEVFGMGTRAAVLDYWGREGAQPFVCPPVPCVLQANYGPLTYCARKILARCGVSWWCARCSGLFCRLLKFSADFASSQLRAKAGPSEDDDCRFEFRAVR